MQRSSLSINKLKLAQLSLIVIGLSASYLSFAGDFYTIIGPDGRPMVIQQKTERKKSEQKVNPEQEKCDELKNQQVKNQQPYNQQVIERNKESLKKNDQAIFPHQSVHQKLTSENELNSSQDKDQRFIDHETKTEQLIFKQNDPLAKIEAQHDSIQVPNNFVKAKEKNSDSKIINSEMKSEINTVQNKAQLENTIEVQTQKVQTQVISNQDKKIEKVQAQESKRNPSKELTNFTEIDGVKYVDNEYLENREFNLERRKRFYVVPETGTARQFETVEREKGISKSMLDKFIRRGETDEYKPVVLSPTYYRLPKQAVIESLEQTCFTGKKLEKAKTLSQKNKGIGLWPVPPLKEKFVYEVIRIEADVQNIQLNSYASSQKNPTYYWPLVVFLDQGGCVIEGVSGFKNENKKDTNFQHAALEGILKKPNGAVYLFMTPLAESIDVQDAQLSNQGQIKLSVLK